MKQTPRFILTQILRPMVPALVTGAVILGCANAPQLQKLPELLQLDQASSIETTPEPAPTPASTARTVSPTPAASPSPSPAMTLSQLAGTYTDGSYTGSAQGYGGTISVEVTVENGIITKIDILSAAGETASFFSRAKAVVDTILSAQTWEVDGISGATYSSNGIKAAVQNALTGETVKTAAPEVLTGDPSALQQISYTAPEGGYIDGTYLGSAQGFGGTITVQVTIYEGSISDISVVSAPGETASYFASAQGVISSVLSAQSPNVDTVSGATYSSTGILNAVKAALEQAGAAAEPSPEPSPTEVPNYGYLDGTYTGSGEGYGGPITVSVTVSGGQITEIEILSAPEETEPFFTNALAVRDEILASQLSQVDAVSGATFSSQGIMQAVEAALADAITAAQELPGVYPEDADAAPTPTPSPTPSSAVSPEPSPLPDQPEAPETTEAVETLLGSATVYPDDNEDFEAYTITLELTLSVATTTTHETDGSQTVETIRSVTGVSLLSADTGRANQRYLERALSGMQDSLLALGSADAVSGATCSSLGIKEAWDNALSGVVLGIETETIPAS